MNVLLKDEKTDPVASVWSLCAVPHKISDVDLTCSAVLLKHKALGFDYHSLYLKILNSRLSRGKPQWISDQGEMHFRFGCVCDSVALHQTLFLVLITNLSASVEPQQFNDDGYRNTIPD